MTATSSTPVQYDLVVRNATLPDGRVAIDIAVRDAAGQKPESIFSIRTDVAVRHHVLPAIRPEFSVKVDMEVRMFMSVQLAEGVSLLDASVGPPFGTSIMIPLPASLRQA